jgi:ABC-2 type transport system permease protein
MAVYEHHYKPYAGQLTAAWSRFLIIPRYAYQDVFQSKLYIAFLALCYLCPLVMMILIYLHHNISFLTLTRLQPENLLPIDSYFFRTYVYIQGIFFSFPFTVLLGPPLISRDLANNALPLYLCRPFSRFEYAVGKMSVLLILLSAITWIPGLLLFCFQCYLEGGGWLMENAWMAGAILLSSWAWILLLALLSLALSAWIKWRMAASAALFAIFIIPNVMGFFISELFHTSYGHLVSPMMIMQTINDSLFRQWNLFELPEWAVLSASGAWVGYFGFCALCLWLLARKVRAYEVVQ